MERSPGCLEAVTLGAWADDRHRKQEENLQWTLWCTVFKTEATIPLASRSNDSWLPTDEPFLVQGNYFAQGYATLTAAAHIQWLVNAEAQNLGPVFSIRENSEGPFQPQSSLRITCGPCFVCITLQLLPVANSASPTGFQALFSRTLPSTFPAHRYQFQSQFLKVPDLRERGQYSVLEELSFICL